MPLEVHSFKDIFDRKPRSEKEKIEDELEAVHCKVCGNFIGVKAERFFIAGNVVFHEMSKGKVICGNCGKCTISQDYRGRVIQVRSRDGLIEKYFLDIIKYVIDNLWGQ